jgi:hypothetical protein
VESFKFEKMAVRGGLDLAAAISALTTAVQRNSERIVRLESGLGVNVEEEYSQLHQQSAQLMEVASAVERLTDAVTHSDQQHKKEIKEMWSVMRRMQGHPVAEVEDPRDEVHMRLLMLEKRFGELEKCAKDKSESQLLNGKMEEMKSQIDKRFTSFKESQDQALSRKANFSDMQMLLADKADESTVLSSLLGKADVSDLHKIASRDVVSREEVRLLVKSEFSTVHEKIKLYEQQMRDMKHEFELLKATITTHTYESNQSYHDTKSSHSEAFLDDRRRAVGNNNNPLEEEWVRRLCSDEFGKNLNEYKKHSESVMESIALKVVRGIESDPESIHSLKLADTK